MIAIQVLIVNATRFDLTIEETAHTAGVQWASGVQDVGQTLAAHDRLEATLQGPDEQTFSAELRFLYPKALNVDGNFSTQVVRIAASGTAPDRITALTSQTNPGTLDVAATGYIIDVAHGSAVFIIQEPPA